MSVATAIAFTSAKPVAQSAAGDSPASNVSFAAVQDFASLLLGKLAAGGDIQGHQPQGNDLPLVSDRSPLESSPQDASMLLAALGFAQTQPQADSLINITEARDIAVSRDPVAAPVTGNRHSLGFASGSENAGQSTPRESIVAPLGWDGLPLGFDPGSKATGQSTPQKSIVAPVGWDGLPLGFDPGSKAAGQSTPRESIAAPLGWDGFPLGFDPGSKFGEEPVLPEQPDSSGKPAKIAGAELPPTVADSPLGRRVSDEAKVSAASIPSLGAKDASTSTLPQSQTTALLDHATNKPVAHEAAATKAFGFDADMPKYPASDTSVAKTPLVDLPSNELSTASIQSGTNLNNATTNSQVQLKLDTPVRDPSWASDFGQKLVWMASHDKQTAQLTINPPDMGPIEISLNINKDSASAFFVSASADVRESIETALPRLREMLASVGIELGQSNVGSESFRQQAGNEEARQGSPRWQADNAILGTDWADTLSPRQTVSGQGGNGLVDTFA
jgi:flagellar hook-length control protein FliK